MKLYRTMVVVGASAGGVEALTQLVRQLPAHFPAAICIVQHIGHANTSYLPAILDRAGPLKAALAEDGELIQSGRIYVAPPDYHLMFDDDHLQLVRGPYENLARPAIDALFRSGAATYTSRVIGVLLSGLLNDGTVGLGAIKRCGGMTIAQDPADATYPDMPRSAITSGVVDYVVPLIEIAPLLDQLVRVPIQSIAEAPDDIVLEAAISSRVRSEVDAEQQIGTLAPISCPECGGPLWEIKDDRMLRFRCHIGHAFTVDALFDAQESEVERALWVAMRTMEERARLLRRMNTSMSSLRTSYGKNSYDERLSELQQAIHTLRGMLEGQSWRLSENSKT